MPEVREFWTRFGVYWHTVLYNDDPLRQPTSMKSFAFHCRWLATGRRSWCTPCHRRTLLAHRHRTGGDVGGLVRDVRRPLAGGRPEKLRDDLYYLLTYFSRCVGGSYIVIHLKVLTPSPQSASSLTRIQSQSESESQAESPQLRAPRSVASLR